MPDWLKILTLIISLSGWLATVVMTLSQGKLPDAATLGIPAALVIALAPPIRIGRRRAPRPRAVRPAAGADATEDDS